jgi:glyceraldehyde 3-phosphate dehydrogenase
MKIGINGLGRIGRTFLRLIHNHPEIQVVAANDIADTQTICHLLFFDSIHGKAYSRPHSQDDDTIIFGCHKIKMLHEKNPQNIFYKKMHL